MQYLIAVDSGHGIQTAGKRTPPIPEKWFNKEKGQAIHEKEFNKPTAEYLIAALQRCGFRTINVSPGTEDVSLTARWTIANKAKADAFISIHYNAKDGQWGTQNGIETIISQYAGEESKKLAKLVHTELIKELGRTDRGVKTDIAQSKINIAVLHNTDMPAILTESGFMDNLKEAKTMLDPEFQKSAAEATCKGVCAYFGVPYITDYTPTGKINKQSDKRAITWLQERLNIANTSYTIPITGLYDAATRAAVLAFVAQKKWNWDTASGWQVGQGTINELKKF